MERQNATEFEDLSNDVIQVKCEIMNKEIDEINNKLNKIDDMGKKYMKRELYDKLDSLINDLDTDFNIFIVENKLKYLSRLFNEYYSRYISDLLLF